MTIDEMISQLEDFRDELGGETEVRLMMQPSWPFEYDISGMAFTSEFVEPDYSPEELAEMKDEGHEPEVEEQPEILYLLEGSQLCYGNKKAWDAGR